MRRKITFKVNIFAEIEPVGCATIAQVLMKLKEGKLKVEIPDIFDGDPTIILTEVYEKETK